MSRRNRLPRWPFLLGLALSMSLLGWWALVARPGLLSNKGNKGIGTGPVAALSAETVAHMSLQAEFDAFQKRFEELEHDTTLSKPDSERLDDLRRRLDEIRRLAERLESQQSREEGLLNLAAQAAAQSLSAVSGMMTFMSILFTIVLFGVALITGLQVSEARTDIEKVKEDHDNQRRQLNETSEGISIRLRGVDSNIKKYEENLARQMTQFENMVSETNTRVESDIGRVTDVADRVGEQSVVVGAFLDNLIEVQASAVAELLGSYAHGQGRPISRRCERLLLKGQELKGRLLLLHPDLGQREAGVLLLSAVGTKIATVDLTRLQREPSTSKDMALQIESAIHTIDERSITE